VVDETGPRTGYRGDDGGVHPPHCGGRWHGKCRWPCLVANRATPPQKWPPPPRNVADSCELTFNHNRLSRARWWRSSGPLRRAMASRKSRCVLPSGPRFTKHTLSLTHTHIYTHKQNPAHALKYTHTHTHTHTNICIQKSMSLKSSPPRCVLPLGHLIMPLVNVTV